MELLYLICQLAAGEVCEEHRVAMIGGNQLTCVYSAPAELARLARPGWRLARWSCAAPEAPAPGAALEPAAFTE